MFCSRCSSNKLGGGILPNASAAAFVWWIWPHQLVDQFSVGCPRQRRPLTPHAPLQTGAHKQTPKDDNTDKFRTGFHTVALTRFVENLLDLLHPLVDDAAVFARESHFAVPPPEKYSRFPKFPRGATQRHTELCPTQANQAFTTGCFRRNPVSHLDQLFSSKQILSKHFEFRNFVAYFG